MEIKKNFFTKLILYILFITNSLFITGLPNIEINEEVPKKYNEKLQYKFDPNIKILFKSVAYPANMIDESFNDFNTLGSFVYQLDSKDQNNSFMLVKLDLKNLMLKLILMNSIILT